MSIISTIDIDVLPTISDGKDRKCSCNRFAIIRFRHVTAAVCRTDRTVVWKEDVACESACSSNEELYFVVASEEEEEEEEEDEDGDFVVGGSDERRLIGRGISL